MVSIRNTSRRLDARENRVVMNYYIAAMIAIFFGVSGYTVGNRHGLEGAPEYVAMQEAIDARWEAKMAEYEKTPDATCDKIYELVIDDLNGLAMDRGEDR